MLRLCQCCILFLDIFPKIASKYKLSITNTIFGNEHKMIRKGEESLQLNHMKKMQLDGKLPKE